MDLAWISVAALVITILVSCTARVNPGVLAIAFAWIIAVGIAPLLGESINVKTVLAGFSSELFLTLSGVTLLFAQAQVNGTLAKVADLAVRCCLGNTGLIAPAVFVLAATMSAVGGGSVATAALVAPMAMTAAANARIPAFLMAVMVGHGAVAGGMSPFALTGIVANGVMERISLKGYEWHTFFHNLAANALVALAGYFVFGGWRLMRRNSEADLASAASAVTATKSESSSELNRKHAVTLLVIGLLIVGVLVFKVHVAMAAFGAAALLTVFGLADEKEVFRAVPWSVIVMVCGVTVLTSLLCTLLFGLKVVASR